MKNILVTGGAGFIGSAFIRHMVAAYPHYNIICYDKLTYAGNVDNLLPVSDETNYCFERGDIAEREAVRHVLQRHNIDTIVNFAAESHVDRSILAPDAFIHTDVVGTYILLDEGRKHGIGRFCQVSTDEVYGDVDAGLSIEDDRFLPNSPYAASKAGGELMLRAYQATYGMDTVVTRGSNTYGPYQYPEKLIPFFTTEALDNRPTAALRRWQASPRLALCGRPRTRRRLRLASWRKRRSLQFGWRESARECRGNARHSAAARQAIQLDSPCA